MKHMELGRVKGQVVSTVRNPGLPHLTFLLVDIVDEQGTVLCAGQIAADILGAGEGEMVLLVRGSSARMVLETEAPLDLSVIGIVDQVTSKGKSLYTK
jgi:microcompartment protein CcmK/EutM